MFSLILSMINARRAQALTVWLLSAVATAAAVAGPVALLAVDQAIVRNEIATATNAERSVSVRAYVNPSDRAATSTFDTVAAFFELPGFDAIRSGEFEAFGPVPDATPAANTPTSRVVFRQRVCEHLTMLSGRCLAGPLEVVVGEDSARRAGLRSGDVAVVQAARYVLGGGLVPDGAEARLTVAGVYRPTDPAEAYWGTQLYFPVTSDGNRREALFVARLTFDLVEHNLGQSSLDAIAPASALTLDRVTGLPDEITRITDPLADDTSEILIDTDVFVRADRIERSRALARQLVPAAFIPLVALCWFVIFLAVGHGVFGRRTELGLVALRGLTPLRRWWLATGETILMIGLGVPLGYLAGHLAVRLVAWLRLGGAGGTELSGAAVPYAAGALAGALLVALLGQRRSLREPVVDLLRAVPRRVKAWQSGFAGVLVAVLAVVATIQLRTSSEGLAGIALLVPGLVVVSVALVAARVTGPLAGVVARRALRRGRLGSGLAAVQLARRPGSQRLFVLFAVSSAMLPFVAGALNVADRARTDRASILTGAATVLTVDGADPRRLLHVTRTVDPAGAWAMAVMPIDQDDPRAPRVLGVDSARLAAVATWHGGFGADAAEVARQLSPPPIQSPTIRATRLSIDLEAYRSPDEPPLEATFVFTPFAGGAIVAATVANLTTGRVTREVAVAGCADGCRLTGIQIPLVRGDQLRLSVYAIHQLEPPGDAAPPDDAVALGEQWRGTGGAEVAATGGELRVIVNRTLFDSGDVVVAPMDAPLPIPIVTTRPDLEIDRIAGLDAQPVGIRTAKAMTMLPRLGADGALVDLEYAERTALFPPRPARAEVWLGPAAPPDAARRLRDGGLAVSSARGADQSQTMLGRQGPALALQFHLAAAAFALVLGLGGLGLVATVDRRRRAEDLAALRVQGLPRRFVGRAALWGYLSTVVVSAGAGLLAAAAAWLAAGDRLPVFLDPVDAVAPPAWPDPGAVLVPWAVATAAMAAGAVVAGRALSRRVAAGMITLDTITQDTVTRDTMSARKRSRGV